MISFIFVKIYRQTLPVLWMTRKRENLFKCHVSEGSDMWWIASKSNLRQIFLSGECWMTFQSALNLKRLNKILELELIISQSSHNHHNGDTCRWYRLIKTASPQRLLHVWVSEMGGFLFVNFHGWCFHVLRGVLLCGWCCGQQREPGLKHIKAGRDRSILGIRHFEIQFVDRRSCLFIQISICFRGFHCRYTIIESGNG